MANRALKRGIAFASLNYVLGPKGMRPQVWYDYRDCARFLRKNAQKFRLDPMSFGSFGISAGGWLISSAGHGTGDHFCNNRNEQMARLYDLANEKFKPYKRKEGEHASYWMSMQNETPAYPGIYGKWQAIAFDFKSFDGMANSGSPAMLDIAGKGYQLRKPRKRNHPPKFPLLPTLRQLHEQELIDYSFAYMTAPKFAGKNVHCPPLIGRKSEREHSYTERVIGEGEAELVDVMLDWYEDRFAAPMPEHPSQIWPAMRIIDGPTSVSLLAPEGVNIHYTTDGSEPTTSSKVFKNPFTVTGTTKIKAIGVMPNRKASGIAIASFTNGPVPPTLAYTDRFLPPAETGKPYSFTFTSNHDTARYWAQGIIPEVYKKGKAAPPHGLLLDSRTGVFLDTNNPGIYWVQIAVQKQTGT